MFHKKRKFMGVFKRGGPDYLTQYGTYLYCKIMETIYMEVVRFVWTTRKKNFFSQIFVECRIFRKRVLLLPLIT